MGHRDNLLVAARTCLLSKGYGATTVRDLVVESGANQASINYHFGSKDRLLNQVLFDLNREWGLVLFEALGVAEGSPVAPAPDRAGAVMLWESVIASIVANEQLWFVNFETIPYVQRDPEIRQMNAAGQVGSGNALARAFAGLDESSDPARRRAVGSHYYSLLIGTALQWLTDPEHAPSASEVVEADHAVRAGVGPGQSDVARA